MLIPDMLPMLFGYMHYADRKCPTSLLLGFIYTELLNMKSHDFYLYTSSHGSIPQACVLPVNDTLRMYSL